MKKIGLSLLLIALTGCLNTWVLPQHEVPLDSFIPTDDDVSGKKIAWNGEGKTFTDTFFPNDCDWKDMNRVVDGDTIVVGRNTRVRMIGIDTPESVIPGESPEPLGVEASNELRYLLQGQSEVCLLTDPIGDTEDKYDRWLRYVYLRDGTDVNGAMISLGFAKGYYKFPFTRKAEFKVLEKAPRSKDMGVWGLKK